MIARENKSDSRPLDLESQSRDVVCAIARGLFEMLGSLRRCASVARSKPGLSCVAETYTARFTEEFRTSRDVSVVSSRPALMLSIPVSWKPASMIVLGSSSSLLWENSKLRAPVQP
jgi:hypothetical protein